MIVRTTNMVTVGTTLGERATYDGNTWAGDESLLKMLSWHNTREARTYMPDPVLNFAQYLCSKYSELSIISSKYTEKEYPDITVF